MVECAQKEEEDETNTTTPTISAIRYNSNFWIFLLPFFAFKCACNLIDFILFLLNTLI